MESETGRSLVNVSTYLRRYIDREFLALEIRGTQAAVLHFIMVTSQRRDVFQKDIERTFDIRRASVTSTVTILERRGYIRRDSVGYDARLKRLVPTEKALELDREITAALARSERRLVRNIPEEKLSVFLEVLHMMRENLE